MQEFLIQLLTSVFGGGAGIAAAAYLGRGWFESRLRRAMEHEALVKRSAFEIKRDACLEALAIIDAAFSQRDWHQQGNALKVIKQPLDISKARGCHSKLSLICDSPEIPLQFLKTLGMGTDEDRRTAPTDHLNRLRNLMRRELGFGRECVLDPQLAWIGALEGATQP